MRIEQNTISRDWTVLYKGRRFYVNFTESDNRTLAFSNRSNWEIAEETDDNSEELNSHVFTGRDSKRRRPARQKGKLVEKLIEFCIRNWDNEFMHAVKEGWKQA